MSAADRMAEIKARADNATPGPWIEEPAVTGIHHHVDVYSHSPFGRRVAALLASYADSEFIAHARTDVPRLVAALQAAIERHRPLRLYEHEGLCQDGTDDHIEERHRAWEYGEYFCLDLPTDYVYCAECRNDDGEQVDYPCPTVCAVEAALGGAS